MSARLNSITITDFRSIRGTISVPLDAPIVLVHGANGAGKTSLLSAIELGLTGQVASLGRVDVDYARHLVHKDGSSAGIDIKTSGLKTDAASLLIEKGAFGGDSLLSAAQARFYSERCFLAQSSLGRLLELYQDSAKRSDSALTKFVKDLLGLDHLDAIIDGLHDAGDVRRLRTDVPGYAEIRDSIPQVEGEIERLESERERTDLRMQELRTRNADLKKGLTSIDDADPTGPTAGADEERELLRATGLRREIEAALLQWRSIANTGTTQERAAAQPRSDAASQALTQWLESKGTALDRVLGRLTPIFPDLPGTSGGPLPAHAAALGAARDEAQRIREVLDKDTKDQKAEEDQQGAYDRASARVRALEQQIAGLATDQGVLAQALAALLPHIHTEDCPVCGRDYREVGDASPLKARVTSRVADLTAAAGQLESLATDRASSMAAMAIAGRALGEMRGRRLDAPSRNRLRTRLAELDEAELALAGMSDDVQEGQRLLVDAASASRALSDLAVQDQGGTALRQSIARFSADLGIQAAGQTEDIPSALERFAAEAIRLVDLHSTNQAMRREMAGNDAEIDRLEASLRPIEDATTMAQGRLAVLIAAKGRADEIIRDARELAKRAGEARTDIVRKVFNGSLNRIWRDLFVRLAPEEPFVPAFAVPQSNGGPVEAVLETHYRSGGRGGDPRSMLSAGNLNTAALTLFLALHLSVTPELPWLVIDDPVQSMDEVHIAQFAALIRTLAKSDLRRQVIIAVHEKPLFDYLALELSPAFQDDRLITIELTRASDGRTLMNYQPHTWTPDQAVAA